MSVDEPDDIFEGDPFDADLVRATEDKQYEHAKAVEESPAVLEYLRARARAYKACLGDINDPNVRIVLKDLAMFCRANETRYHAEDKKQNMLEGRAEVFYRVQQHTRLTADDLFLLYTDAQLKR